MIFLSEDNLLLHKEYVNKKRLQLSIIEKSISGIKNKSVGEILGMRLSPRDKADTTLLLSEIVLHDLFFSSYSDEPYPGSAAIRRDFGTESNLLNRMYALGMGQSYGFAVLLSTGRRYEVLAADDYVSVFTRGTPVLALDVCEHAYFRDYGFDKERYLVSALTHLDLSRVDEF